MTRALRYFVPAVYVVLYVLVAIAFTACGVSWATAMHDARMARQQVCAARLDALRARNPFMESFARNVDSCVALQVFVKEDR